MSWPCGRREQLMTQERAVSENYASSASNACASAVGRDDGPNTTLGAGCHLLKTVTPSLPQPAAAK